MARASSSLHYMMKIKSFDILAFSNCSYDAFAFCLLIDKFDQIVDPVQPYILIAEA